MAEALLSQNEGDEYNCGFCLQKATYMEQPKQLPCSHVFCLPCLQGDAKKECPVCQQAYDLEATSVTDYSKVKGNKENTETQNTDRIKCDVCSTEKAVCFCVTCEQKLCDQHFKLHEQSTVFFQTKHMQIDISVYMSEPNRYDPRQCKTHSDKRLNAACYACHQVFCEGCEPEKGRCPGRSRPSPKGRYHNTCSTSDMGANIRNRLQNHIKEIADEVTEGLNLEKKIWTRLDDAETDVNNTISEIDAAVQQAIASINEMADKLKQSLSAYLQHCRSKVEDHCCEIRELREKFENSWRMMSQRLASLHDTEVITEFESMKSEVESALDDEYEPVIQLGKMILSNSSAGNQGEAMPTDTMSFCLSLKELKLTELIELIDISFKKSITRRDEKCYSVSWSGTSLFYSMDNLVIEHLDDEGETEVAIPGPAGCVTQAGCAALAALVCKTDSQNKRVKQIRIGRHHMLPEDDSIICEYQQDNNDLCHLSINRKYIATCDTISKDVKVFSIRGEHIMSIGSGQIKRPYGVLLMDNAVLVADCIIDGCLYKYNLNSDSDPVWKCGSLIQPTGICADSKGYIYVASHNGAVIYLISPQGKLIKGLTCEELTNTKIVHDISLSDDGETLALACREEGVKLFSITTRT